jgi:hypothetical protein
MELNSCSFFALRFARASGGQKKAEIQCYNCSRDGHYQSGYLFPTHCSVCDLDGHTTGMCPKANKQPVLQWYGYAIDGVAFTAWRWTMRFW